MCRTATALAIGARQPSALNSPAKLGPDAVLPVPAGGQPLQVAWLAGGTSLSGRYLNLSPFMHQAPVSIRCAMVLWTQGEHCPVVGTMLHAGKRRRRCVRMRCLCRWGCGICA